MSVYIKGMEMPTSCRDCACYQRKSDPGYYDYEVCYASGTIFNDGYSSVTGHKVHINPFNDRLDNCPLVPVPEHGRLIDLDAIPKKAWRGEKEDLVDELILAPTVIPADPDKEGEG